MRRTVGGDLRALLHEAGLPGLRQWLADTALGGAGPAILVGSGAEVIGQGVTIALIRCGADVGVAPPEWADAGYGLPPADDLPAITVLFPGLDVIDDDQLDLLARHTALLICGDQSPNLARARVCISSLAEARVEDLEILAAAGWPWNDTRR